MKRFVSDYAKFRKDTIKKSQFMQEQIKDEQIKKIGRIETMLDRGLLSIDEAMRGIADVGRFDDAEILG